MSKTNARTAMGSGMDNSESDGTDPIIYVNGEFLDRANANISVFDHVVLYGDGVYDTMVAMNKRLFKLDAHVDRLFESAHAVKITVPLTKAETAERICETVRRNGLSSAYVKILVTRGVGREPLLSPRNCVPGVVIFAVPYMSQAGEDGGETGVRLITSSLRRVPNESMSTKIKACNYMNHVLMRMEANDRGADDALELDIDGYVCEAPGYNVFVVKNGRLLTPADNILMGITRQTVLELASIQGIETSAERIQPFDFYNADEAFLSSTAGGIVPIVELDQRTIGQGKPGPITKQMLALYEDLLATGSQSTAVG